ncbi:hypothetical protein [Paraflavitalea speifideaquila]|nr:hypothetical protein [Paraflavitalea speifideiaquila]
MYETQVRGLQTYSLRRFLQAGAYHLQVIIPKGNTTKKIIVQ